MLFSRVKSQDQDKQLSRFCFLHVFQLRAGVERYYCRCRSGEVFVILLATGFTASFLLHRSQIFLDGVGLGEFEFLRDVGQHKGVRLDNYTAVSRGDPSADSAYELAGELKMWQESCRCTQLQPLHAQASLQG